MANVIVIAEHSVHCPPFNRLNPLNLYLNFSSGKALQPLADETQPHFLMLGWTFRDGGELNQPNGSSSSFAAGIDQGISIAGQSAKLKLLDELWRWMDL